MHLTYGIVTTNMFIMPLPGLADWFAFLERVFHHVKSHLRQWDQWRALHGMHGSEIDLRHLLGPLGMFGPMAGTSWIHS